MTLFDEYITPAEAGRMLGYEGTDIVYELYHCGEIKGWQRRSGAKIFIEKASLLAYRQKLVNDKLK